MSNYNPTPLVPSSTYVPVGYQQPGQTTVIMQPVVNQPFFIGKHPSQITCPYCKASVITRVDYKSGCGTWLICLGLCFIGLWLGCQFIPFCVDGCKDSHHSCPNCNQSVGRKDLL